MGFLGYIPSSAAYGQARHSALKALEIDDTLAAAHALKACLRAVEFDWKGAEREFLRALDLGPNSEEARIYYCQYCLIPMGRLDETITVWRKAIDTRDHLVSHGRLFPIYDPLRSHPRYRALLRKMNLEP